MIKILITENQRKMLFNEAMSNEFRFDELKKINGFAAKIRYCQERLGRHIGNGTSRLVFQIDDRWVLKLAKNTKGIVQNEVEAQEDWYKENLNVFPQLYRDVSDMEGFTYIVSEFVLPAKETDFIECFGITHEVFASLMEYISPQWREGKRPDLNKLLEKLEDNENFMSILDYVTNYLISGKEIGRISNLGLAMRFGRPYIVILDSGYNDEVSKYYEKNRRLR